jgi:hypothetical protein
MPAPMPPVFVGGTGRSGTTVMARLLGAHPALHNIHVEVRFINDPGGLCDLAAARTTYYDFRRKMLRGWFYRDVGNGETRGVHRLLDRNTVRDALPALEDGLRADPWRAGEAFVHRLFDPLAAARGADRWVEMTPPNARFAGDLFRMFPDMLLIHMIRDGRDVACSVASRNWGPSTPEEGLDWWARRLEQAFEGCDQVPPDRVLLVRLEQLVGDDGEAELARVCAFLGLDVAPALREYFEAHVNVKGAHLGRWAEDVPADRRAAFEARYEAIVERFRAQGRPL